MIKVVILAGGFGTRISEETVDKPKPMVLIDDKPILWHIMNAFAIQGYDEFVLALGYKSDSVKRWLVTLNDLSGDISVNLQTNKIKSLSSEKKALNWQVSALETGYSTQTGGRVSKCMDKFPNEPLIVTYGDGLANIRIPDLIRFHESHGKLATVTSVRPPARFGHMEIVDGNVVNFGEKNQADSGWINGGFFVLEPEVRNYIWNDEEPFETGALPRLVEAGELMAYQHSGFWSPMDTLRERQELTNLAKLQTPPWLEGI